jgi:hypothetical protein
VAHTLADFLSRALPWPTPERPGWVNIHYRAADRKGITGSRAFDNIGDCLGFVRWAINHPEIIHDVYFCTSLQKEHGDPTQRGSYRAERSADNAVASKLLFADVDKYASKLEAFAAVKSFCDASRSPYPTSMVDSGNGYHAYWFLTEALPKIEWLQRAAQFDGLLTRHGLRHDNVSTDMARILRVPETYNFKQEPAKPVFIKLLNGDIDLLSWQSLQEATSTPAKIHHAAPLNNFHQPIPAEISISSRALAGRPSLLFARELPIDERVEGGTIDPRPVVKLCPMFRETLAAGGEGVGQPLWHQQAFACTFLLDGKQLFHDLSCKHRDYSRDEADAMYDRKLVDRHTKGLGYPSCVTFETNGSLQCKSCPVKGKVVSPLNLRAPVESDDDEPLVPVDNKQGFYYGRDCGMDEPDWIYGRADSRGGKALVPIVYSKIYSVRPFKAEQGDGIGVRIVHQTHGSHRNTTHISSKDFERSELIWARANQGGMALANRKESFANLVCSWRGRMQNAEEEIARCIQYGWVIPEAGEDDDIVQPTGFAFDGWIFQTNGRTSPSISRGDQTEDVYCRRGNNKAWFKALNYLLQTKRPEVQVLALTGFAAPLIRFTGHYSVAVMAMGESGGNKSAATAVGLAVWADPRTAAQKPSASTLAIMKRMGVLHHLPVALDDLQYRDFPVSRRLVMDITQGAEGAKLNSNRDEREQGKWDTIIVTTSNRSLAEYIEQEEQNESSALVRCFEFAVPKLYPDSEGFQNQAETTPVFSALNENHGHLGLAYAKKLGANPAHYRALVAEVGERITQQVGIVDSEERFWYAAATTIVAGAIAANELLTELQHLEQFDVEAVEACVVKIYKDMRERVAEAKIKSSSSEWVKRQLITFLNDYARPRNMVVATEEMHDGAGRPQSVSARFPQGQQYMDMKKIGLRWVARPKKEVIISQEVLFACLREHKASTNDMKKGLLQYYNAKIMRGKIGVGLNDIKLSTGPQPLFRIEINPGSWLDEQWQIFLGEDERRKIVTLPPPQSRDR